MPTLVPVAELPKTLPYPNAMQAPGFGPIFYESEIWELEYQSYRYLERMPDLELAARHQSIVRNMKALIAEERNAIPIQSFLSSWYWFRKEHQTRLEFHLRGAFCPLPTDLWLASDALSLAPARPKHPNAGDVLFRFGKHEHLGPMLHEGKIRVSPASTFVSLDGDGARKDEECCKTVVMPGGQTKVTTMDGRDIPIIGDLRRSTLRDDYYMLCMASDWHPQLFSDFGADACVVIKDVDEFASRLDSSFELVRPGWQFYYFPVHYFDPHERLKNEPFDAIACKDFEFAYQREYRFFWVNKAVRDDLPYQTLQLGTIDDIAELHSAPTTSS